MEIVNYFVRIEFELLCVQHTYRYVIVVHSHCKMFHYFINLMQDIDYDGKPVLKIVLKPK